MSHQYNKRFVSKSISSILSPLKQHKKFGNWKWLWFFVFLGIHYPSFLMSIPSPFKITQGNHISLKSTCLWLFLSFLGFSFFLTWFSYQVPEQHEKTLKYVKWRYYLGLGIIFMLSSWSLILISLICHVMWGNNLGLGIHIQPPIHIIDQWSLICKTSLFLVWNTLDLTMSI